VTAFDPLWARAVQRRTGMKGVQSFEELICWQRANEVKLGVYALSRSNVVRRDVKFRDQIRDAAAGGPRLIAEGFGRYLPAESSTCGGRMEKFRRPRTT
jgi:hypothetical protein